MKDDLITNFSKNRKNFCISVFSNAKKEENNSINILNDDILRTEIVKDQLKLSVRDIKRVVIVGSRANGLATQPDTFLDLYIEIGNNYSENGNKRELLSTIAATLKKYTIGSQLVFKNVTFNDSNIQTVHCLTELNCKLFCGNGLIVEKSELIRLYVNSDERIRQLILIIKAWAKYCNIPELTMSYSLTWIVLYYLIKSSFIEPVIVLKNNIKSEKTISGWKCGYADLSCNLVKSNGPFKITDELLKGFFEFYGNDDLIKFVHCPLTGESFLKSEFSKFNLPVPNYENYIKFCKFNSSDSHFSITKGFCLQDPIELNKNITDNFLEMPYSKFKWFCRSMTDILSKSV